MHYGGLYKYLYAQLFAVCTRFSSALKILFDGIQSSVKEWHNALQYSAIFTTRCVYNTRRMSTCVENV